MIAGESKLLVNFEENEKELVIIYDNMFPTAKGLFIFEVGSSSFGIIGFSWFLLLGFSRWEIVSFLILFVFILIMDVLIDCWAVFLPVITISFNKEARRITRTFQRRFTSYTKIEAANFDDITAISIFRDPSIRKIHLSMNVVLIGGRKMQIFRSMRNEEDVILSDIERVVGKCIGFHQDSLGIWMK